MTINYVNLGQSNLSGDAQALFRDKFIPYLLTTLNDKRVLKGFVRNKQITSGKSATFHLFGTATAGYVKKGDNLLEKCGDFAKADKTIYIDPWLTSQDLLDNLEEKMSETEDRKIIADAMAEAIANKEDRQLLQVGVLAARSATLITGEDRGGSVIYAGEDVNTDAQTLAAAIYAAGVELDLKNIPESDRKVYINPLQYALLCQYDKIINRETGNGSFPKGVTGEIDNMYIVKTTHLPNTNITAPESGEAAPNNTYHGDFSKTSALVMHKDALGVVSLVHPIVEAKWILERLATLLTIRLSQGMGFLRPECAVEISSQTASSGSGSGT